MRPSAASGGEAPDVPTDPGLSLLGRYRALLSSARASLFWACLTRQRTVLRWLFVTLALESIATFQIANLTRGMVDNAIVEQSAPLWPYVTHIGFWAAWALVFEFLRRQLSHRLSYAIEFDLRVWLYTHIQSADLARLDQLATGQLVTRSITDLQLVEQVLRVFPTLVGFAPLLLAMALLVIILNPWLGILAVLSLPINALLLRRFSRRLRALSWAELNERAEVTRAIDEPVRGIRVVKAFGREQDERAKVEGVTDTAYRFAMSRTRLLARYDGAMKAVPMFVQAALLAFGAWRLSEDALSLGTFLLAFQLCSGLAALAGVFDELGSYWQYLRGAQDRLAEMLALSARPVTDGRTVSPSSTGLELDAVALQLGDRRLQLGVQLHVAPGELVVVQGPPASGKSTLAAIASGLIVPHEGEARLDGIPLQELDPLGLRRAVRVVSEEPLLLATSLRENLLLGAWGEVSDEQLTDALRQCGAEELLSEIAGGLDGTIGDRGLTVSGGQRQRIALARALVAGPRVLVLDDALSAVNPALEIEIVRRVRQALPETAILYITRRDGLGDVADRMFRLGPLAVAVPADDGDAAVAPTPGPMPTGMDEELALLVSTIEPSAEPINVTDDMTYRDDLTTFGSVAGHFRALIAGSLVLVFLAGLCKIAPDLIFGRIGDLVGTPDETNLAGALLAAGALVLTGILYWVLGRQFRITAQMFNQRLVLLLRRRMFARLMKLGVNYYDRELPGDVATRVVADLDNILRFLQGPGFLLLSGLAITTTGLAAILVVAPTAFPIVVLMIGLVLLVTFLQLGVAMSAFGWAREELQVVTRKFQEDFAARREIRHLGAHAIQTQKFVEAAWDRRRARYWATTIQNVHAALVTFLAVLMSALLLWKTGTGVLALSLSVGAALAVQVLANTATIPLKTIGELYNQFLDVRVSWQRLKEPFVEPVLPTDPPDAAPCPALTGTVRFDDVSFAYPSTPRRVLRGASFTLQPGALTALVGYTGAGKSSIAKLLMRTYDPVEGRITVDGIDIRTFALGSFRSSLGVVPQDPFLFRGTVSSNIRYGKPEATEEEVAAALEAVGAAEVLLALPGGVGHVVEEEARNLTAAQRQLVALARAWLTRPALLVLDESTSLLDAGMEDRVLAAVRELGCTTLMITHRESAARRADNIIVVDAGRVVDEGPAADVARPGGTYARLWSASGDDGERIAPTGAC